MAETISNGRVTPFSDSTTAVTLPLTYFDTLWFKFPPVERLFFYQFPHLTCDLFNSVILPKLKHSLSLTLLHYLPLAGNLMWPDDSPKPAIYYFPNDGVSFTVAVSNADFNLLSGNGICRAVEFHPLVPQLWISDHKAEAIAIQITLFPNEGFSIGISSHHVVLDGKSSTMFVKSWAYLCNQLQQNNPCLLPDQLTPCFDRTHIKDPKGIDMVYVKHWLDFDRDAGSGTRSLKVLPIKEVNPNLFRKTFELNREDIKKLRERVNKVSQKEVHLSTFVVTCAHVYVCLCLVKAKGELMNLEANNTTVEFAVTADCRSRLDPPIPVNYIGNCVDGQFLSAKASDFMEENGVAFVAAKLSDFVKGLEGAVIEGSEDKIIRILAILKESGPLMLSIAGSTRFDVYGSNFGWGRPNKVEIVSVDRTGAISLAESRDGDGGVEIGIVLEKQQMEVFASLFLDGLKNH